MFFVSIICSLTLYFQSCIFTSHSIIKFVLISFISILKYKYFLIMIKLRNFIQFAFARNRIRREIQFDPKLKDFSNEQIIKLQEQDLRSEFEKVPDQIFSSVLNDPHPKLKKRFLVEKSRLNKKIRQSYKEGIKRELLQAHGEDDLDYLAASKSHLNDQKDEIQFERKFKQQLFRTKQTLRLIGKKQKQINNYVQGQPKDHKYLQYEDAKKQLKNKKISNMMSLNRNNEQLQLLIQSGFLNNPNNIKAVISELSTSTTQGLLEHKDSIKTQPSRKQVVEFKDKKKQIASKLEDIGPQQLKERQKVVQFLQNYEQQHQKDKLSCQQDLNLLKQIKQYQQQLYLSRYDSINFRFKGKVNFGFFKENQLISYIRNQNIEPKQLLAMFKQNLNAVSKFKVPILTPPVVGALYSKTSLYRFPQTERNNRINMLNDKNFQMLERKVFKDIALINDTDFCSVVWAYSQNHQDQQGILNQKLSDKILSVIVQQLQFRIFNLKDEDLGLIMRGMARLPLAKAQKNWTEIIKYLDSRLSSLANPYAIQSVFQFLMVLPSSTEIVEAVSRNIQLFNSFKWEEVNTIMSFTHAAGLLLKNAKIMDGQLAVRKTIKNILLQSEHELFQVLPNVSINNLPQFLAVVRQSQASLDLPKLVNLIKKLTVDNIKTQKQHIKQQSLSNLAGNFALADVQKYLSSKIGKYEQKNNTKLQMVMRKLCLMQLIPFQAIPYNSSQYFVYHDLANLTHTQMRNIGSLSLAKIMQNLSLVKYKNEKFYDELVTTILENIDESIEKRAKQHEIVTGYSNHSIVKILMCVCNAYSLQRRSVPLYEDALQLLLGPKYYPFLCRQSPNALIRFVSGVIGLSNISDLQQPIQQKLSKIVSNMLAPLCKANALLPQQVASVTFCATILQNYRIAQQICEQTNLKQINDPSSKFIIVFCNLIAKLSNNKTIESQLSQQFSKTEQQFYKNIIQEILYNELCIGTTLSYHQVHSKLSEVLKTKHAGQTIINKKWAIEIPDIKTVYFIGTYDHLMARGNQDIKNTILQPHGVWKLYYKYYELQGWSIKTIIGFLEGK